jgi:hypothetical protein
MNRPDRHAKRPPIEIPIEMLAERAPVASKPLVSKALRSNRPELIPPKHGLAK